MGFFHLKIFFLQKKQQENHQINLKVFKVICFLNSSIPIECVQKIKKLSWSIDVNKNINFYLKRKWIFLEKLMEYTNFQR